MSWSIELTNVDKTAAGMGICFAAVLIYKDRIDYGKIQDAAIRLSELHPSLASRVRLDGGTALLDCTSGSLIELTCADWPEGSVKNARAELIKSWEGTLPAQLQPPIYIAQMRADEVTAGREAPFKLRLTQLGDGGSILAATTWHGLLDGGRMLRVLVDLSSHYRGEATPDRVDSRRLMTTAGLAEVFPDNPDLAKAAKEQQNVQAESPDHAAKGPAIQSLAHWLERSPEFPRGPSSLRYTILHLPRDDLAKLKAEVQEELGRMGVTIQVSQHDVVHGIVWSLRRVSAGLALPSQEAVHIKEVGFDVIDLEANVFPEGAMTSYYGNAYSRVPVFLPPSERGAGFLHQEGSLGTNADAWRSAIALIAAENRKMLSRLRSGQGLNALVAKVLGKEMPQDPQMDGAISRGFTSSWERCPTEQAVFEGPPAKLVPFFLKGSDSITLVTRAEDGGAELNFIIPTELMQHTGLQQVLPNAGYLQA